MKLKHFLVFAIVNIILLAGVFSFGISPGLQNISRLRSTVSRQESQIALRTGLALEYESNLKQLQYLHEGRTFLLDEQNVNLEFSKIEQLVSANNLQMITYAFGEQVGFYTDCGQHITRISARLYSYGNVADIFNLLHKLEDTSANIITADVVWRSDYRARINIEFTLLSVNI